MNIDKFYNYLNDFTFLNEKSLEELKQLIETYPFFNVLYVIYAKNIQKYSDYELNDIIPLASMYVISRSHFYEIIKKEILDSTKTDAVQYSSTTKKEKIVSEEVTSIKEEIITDKNYYSQKSEEESITYEENSNLPVIADNKDSETYYASMTFYQNSTLTFRLSQKIYAINTSEIFYEPEKKIQNNNNIDALLKKIENFKITPASENVEPVIYEYGENEEFYTETMAEILVSQELYEKAISIYEKLILKFPEKFNYFANKIKELKFKTNKF